MDLPKDTPSYFDGAQLVVRRKLAEYGLRSGF